MNSFLIALALVGHLVGEPHRDGGGSDRIELYSTVSDMCKGTHGAKDAAYIYRPLVAGKPELSGTKVRGCWLEDMGRVLMIFEDGDAMAAPRSAIKWAPGAI